MSAFCPRCGVKLNTVTNFCPDCGENLSSVKPKSKITFGRFLLLVIVAAGIFMFSWSTQKALSGKKPDQQFSANSGSSHASSQNAHGSMPAPKEAAPDPELDVIRKEAKEKPLDMTIQKQYTTALIQRIRASEQPEAGLVFEVIDVLRNTLKINPDDAEALIAMADISFDQQAFSKAIDFYKRYLAIEKDDLGARARYASSLTFTGEFDQALNELNQVLKKDPNNFHAKAYLAITYAQMGKHNEARIQGTEALNLAPSEEARARFTQFLESLDKEKIESTSPKRGNIDDSEPIVAVVKNNPVAGPKFKERSLSPEGNLILLMQDFPMEQMPPFVKDKFLKSIKDAGTSSTKQKPFKIIIREASTLKDMEVIEIF